MSLTKCNRVFTFASPRYSRPEPLWRRVPTRTEAGEYVADFMMLIHRFNRLDSDRQTVIVDALYEILQFYTDVVLFADLNARINLLWISHRPRPGIGLEVAARIHDRIPEARLVSHQQHL